MKIIRIEPCQLCSILFKNPSLLQFKWTTFPYVLDYLWTFGYYPKTLLGPSFHIVRFQIILSFGKQKPCKTNWNVKKIIDEAKPKNKNKNPKKMENVKDNGCNEWQEI